MAIRAGMRLAISVVAQSALERAIGILAADVMLQPDSTVHFVLQDCALCSGRACTFEDAPANCLWQGAQLTA